MRFFIVCPQANRFAERGLKGVTQGRNVYNLGALCLQIHKAVEVAWNQAEVTETKMFPRADHRVIS